MPLAFPAKPSILLISWPSRIAGLIGRSDQSRTRSQQRRSPCHKLDSVIYGFLGQKASALLNDTKRSPRRPRKYLVYLAGHYEVVLMQPLNLLGLQRDSRIAPTKTDIGMMAFGFCEFTNLLDKAKRLPEILEPEVPLDSTSIVHQLPIWGLRVE
jgi:hypothetical protein